MRKIILLGLVIFLSFSATATTLSNEDITIDLNSNKLLQKLK